MERVDTKRTFHICLISPETEAWLHSFCARRRLAEVWGVTPWGMYKAICSLKLSSYWSLCWVLNNPLIILFTLQTPYWAPSIRRYVPRCKLQQGVRQKTIPVLTDTETSMCHDCPVVACVLTSSTYSPLWISETFLAHSRNSLWK